jgi:hypothetical protein
MKGMDDEMREKWCAIPERVSTECNAVSGTRCDVGGASLSTSLGRHWTELKGNVRCNALDKNAMLAIL